MKGLYLRGNVWWIRWTVKGIQQRKNTYESDELKAIDVARRYLNAPAEVATGNLPAEFREYLAHLAQVGRKPNYITGLKERLRPWLEENREMFLGDFKPAHLQAWFDKRRAEVKINTAIAYLGDIERFFKWAIGAHKITLNPCANVSVPIVQPIRRKVWIDNSQAQKLLDECQDRELKFVLMCGLKAGMRKDEVVHARPSWFSLQNRTVTITIEEGWSPKDRTERTIPLHPEFLEFLKGYPMDGAYMLAPEVEEGKCRYRFDFRTKYENYIKAKGLEITYHDLRRSFASQLASAGVSLYKIANWLGDGHAIVEEVYAHLQAYDDDIARR